MGLLQSLAAVSEAHAHVERSILPENRQKSKIQQGEICLLFRPVYAGPTSTYVLDNSTIRTGQFRPPLAKRSFLRGDHTSESPDTAPKKRLTKMRFWYET